MTEKNHFLVTGGLGFIGHKLIERLVAGGHRATVLDDLSNNCADAAEMERLGVRVLVGDIRDPARVAEAVAGTDTVIHLAAQTGVAPSFADPMKDLTLNGVGLLTVLDAARAAGARRFVYASSNATVGAAEPPMHEDIFPAPVSPYGVTKLLGEGYCRTYAAVHGMDTVVLRFANVYGPGSRRKGSVVAKFIKRLLAGEPAVINGDGTQTRDFVYIDDLLRAIELALEKVKGAGLFCVASGIETSVNAMTAKLAAIYEAEFGRPMPLEYGAPLPGEVARNYCTIRRATEQLGYTPQVDLDEGLRRTWRWFVDEWLPSQGKGA